MDENELRKALAIAINMIGEREKSQDDFFHALRISQIDPDRVLDATREMSKADLDFEELERKGIGNTKLSMIVLHNGEVSQAVYIPEDDPFDINELVLHTADSMDWEYRVSGPSKRVMVKLKATANGNLGEWDTGTFDSFTEESGCSTCKGWLDEQIESVDLKEEVVIYKPEPLDEALQTIENWMDSWARMGIEWEVL